MDGSLKPPPESLIKIRRPAALACPRARTDPTSTRLGASIVALSHPGPVGL